ADESRTPRHSDVTYRRQHQRRRRRHCHPPAGTAGTDGRGLVLRADLRAPRWKMTIAAIIFPIMLAFAALGAEGGLWYADQHQLRNVADAAALAAGWARREGMDEEQAALDAVAGAGFNDDTDYIELNSPPVS